MRREVYLGTQVWFGMAEVEHMCRRAAGWTGRQGPLSRSRTTLSSAQSHPCVLNTRPLPPLCFIWSAWLYGGHKRLARFTKHHYKKFEHTQKLR